MKFNFLKFKRNNLPPLKSLRPPVFDTETFWFGGLGICLLVFLITALAGFRFFNSQYFETYKKTKPVENFEDVINISKLRNTIKERDDFINRQTSLPKDPSI